MSILDSTTRTVLRHIVTNLLIGAVGLVAAVTMDWFADLVKSWHRSQTVVFGCRLLANWLFILDLSVIVGSATLGAIKILRRIV